MPIMIASRPSWMISRACAGVLTMRSQPSPGPPAVRVDVVLQLVQPLGLQPDAVHLVAGVLLHRVLLAQGGVLDQQVRHEAQAAGVRALQPAPVELLVGQRCGSSASDAKVGQPTGSYVAVYSGPSPPSGTSSRRFERVLLVVAAAQRVLDAVRVPRPTAAQLAAEELEGHAVDVRVEEAAHGGGRALAGRLRGARGAGLDLGPARAGRAVRVGVARLVVGDVPQDERGGLAPGPRRARARRRRRAGWCRGWGPEAGRACPCRTSGSVPPAATRRHSASSLGASACTVTRHRGRGSGPSVLEPAAAKPAHVPPVRPGSGCRGHRFVASRYSPSRRWLEVQRHGLGRGPRGQGQSGALSRTKPCPGASTV